MGKIYIKIINLVKYNYEFTARYLPALIFTIILETSILYFNKINFDLGIFDLAKIPLFIMFSLIISVIPKIIATNISGFVQTLYWDKFGNSIITFLQKTNNISYKELLNKFQTTDELIANLLKETRNDKKLLSKNIFYGFFRNFTFLVLIFSIINVIYFQYFTIENMILMIFCIFMLYISSQRYIEQICKSYIEKIV
ncbi:hypothetical protein CVO_06015 [Sulfurimonas sp. CVO]|uniref:hypothetical protein n=1 Tax=Sulfurimonas sp. CVO TaxID=2283483 RepID=UPI00132EA119|nr:hypothetical protein [Sulfurimonas sp. CVO]QHG91416.1 hypothetical protein CVO_06015 [Sulfurimonas sp. CVO]